MTDTQDKKRFRQEKCNIVEMTPEKRAIFSKGSSILSSLQSQEEFDKLLDCNNWAVTQTIKSNVLFFDSDTNQLDQKLEKFFNRIRDKYVENNKHIHSMHGFLKVVDADHTWCVAFAKLYHNHTGIEIFAEKHWLNFAGIYYNEKNIDQTRKTTWYRKDDLHLLPIINTTKEQLGLVFGNLKVQKLDKKLNQYVKAGVGNRHDAIILTLYQTAKTMQKAKLPVTFNSLYQSIMQSSNIENISEYTKGQKQKELENTINWVIEHHIEEVYFIQAYLRVKNRRYAHIVDTGEHFNCWYWNYTYWTEDADYYILQDILSLQSRMFAPSKATAIHAADIMSTDPQTLKVRLDEKKYIIRSRSIITNSFGEYFDLVNGTIKDVDPSITFYKYPQLQPQFTKHTQTPSKFLEFIQERFSEEDGTILLDHLAGSLLHTTVLGAKPKILYIVGPHNTFKSLIIEILKKIINTNLISMVTNEQLDERFGFSMIAEKMINYSEEQNARVPKNPAALKNSITMESGFVEVKNAKRPVFASRFPRHIVMCNKVAPIARDDNDDSIFIRNQYIQTKDVQSTKDWRKILLDDDEIQRITMFFLNRAHQIFNDVQPIRQQTLEISKEKYEKLTHGAIKDIIEKYYDSTDDSVGTLWLYFWRDIRKRIGNNISKKRLHDDIEELGFTRNRDRYFRSGEAFVFSESPSSDDDEKVTTTIILGLKPKRDKTTTIQEGMFDGSVK